MRADEALAAAEADRKAETVQSALKDVEQAGRGIAKVFGQLSTGVPRGNELYYLGAVVGYVNAAMMSLIELDTPPATPETQGPKIALG